MRPACVRCSLRVPVWLVTTALARAGATLAPARCFSDRAGHELATSQFVSDIGDNVRSRDDYTDLCVYTIRRSDLIERLSRKKGRILPTGGKRRTSAQRLIEERRKQGRSCYSSVSKTAYPR